MSHFTAAVISKTPADVDRLMLPFYEWDGSDDYPKHFLKFHNAAAEYQNQYMTGLAKMIRFRKTGKFVMPYATELYREISEAEYNRLNDENRNLHDGQQHYLRREKSGNDAPKYGVYDLEFFDAEEITVPWTELYPTIENFLEDYYGYEFNKEYGAYGYLRNVTIPNTLVVQTTATYAEVNSEVGLLQCQHLLLTELSKMCTILAFRRIRTAIT